MCIHAYIHKWMNTHTKICTYIVILLQYTARSTSTKGIAPNRSLSYTGSLVGDSSAGEKPFTASAFDRTKAIPVCHVPSPFPLL